MESERHPFWEGFGAPVPRQELRHPHARALAAYADSDLDEETGLVGCRRSRDGHEAVLVSVRTYPPQHPVADIRPGEELAAVFADESRHPTLLAMRRDFPETPHQNIALEGEPRHPCLDDQTWDDAAPGWTPYGYLERVKWWLNAAAMGELTGTGQFVDPLFIPTGPDLLVPVTVLAETQDNLKFILVPPEGVQGERPRCYHLVRADDASIPRFVSYRALWLTAPVSMTRSINMPPGNLNQLLRRADEVGLHLVEPLRNWIRDMSPGEWTSFPVLLLNFPVTNLVNLAARQDIVAFGFECTIGHLGTLLGVLDPIPDKKGIWGRLVTPGIMNALLLEAEKLLPMAVQVEFGADLARPLSGIDANGTMGALLVGAGAIGSHVALTLTREGRHSWTVVDPDWLRPHNLARHVLGQRQVGRSKARELAAMLSELGGIHASAIVCDVQRPGEHEGALRAAATAARVIIDASASVSAARHVSDWTFAEARRVSVFFNPAGTATVLLAEDAGRGTRLDQLEAVYYRMVLRDESLVRHLAPPHQGYRYAGSCRAISARIPESRVAVLSGLASAGISAAVEGECAEVRIWSMHGDGSVSVVHASPSSARREELVGWTVLLDDELAAKVAAWRMAALPAETGGALVGVVDNRRRVITIVDALPPPSDSHGDPDGFTRGTEGLEQRLRDIAARTADMVRYIGEWHTHPCRSTSTPSSTDLEQLVSLRHELRREGLPATMLIAGADGERVILLDGLGGE